MHPYVAYLLAKEHLDGLHESADRSREARELRRRRREERAVPTWRPLAVRRSPMGCAT